MVNNLDQKIEKEKEDSVIVVSKIKTIAEGFSISREFEEALNKEVKNLIKRACQRCKDNKRNTLMARDL